MVSGQNIAEIIVDLPVKTDNASYQYLIPSRLKKNITIGSTVIVPFSGRRLIGYVVELGAHARRQSLKEIIDFIDEPPILSAKEMRLFKWISDYYLAPLNEAVKLGLPPGRVRRLKEVYYFNYSDYLKDDQVHNRSIERMLQESMDWDTKKILKQNGNKIFNDLIKAGYIEKRYELKEPRVKEKLVKVVALNNSAALNLNNIRGKKQKLICEYLRGRPQPNVELSELLKDCEASWLSVKSLRDKGLVTVVHHEKVRAPTDLPITGITRINKLTPHQIKAVTAVKKAIEARKYAAFLLEGVTGSGKTEVYMRTINEVIEKGRGAIVLVPEIALTPQLTDRFHEQFNDLIAVIHSGLSIGERFDQWRRIYRQEARIVIGPRSALFAPLDDIGLIVIDEEHETSFKQNRSPRYNARDVAAEIAALNKAVLILGTATPSLETKYKADRGDINYLSLPERVMNKGMPKIEIVDMRLEAENDNYTIFSNRLRDEMQTCIANKQQMIIFLNRRGYSSFLLCKKCGYVAICKNCSISLTYHYKGSRLKCHHCGYSRPAAPFCPKCKSTKLKYSGTGTEKVERELRKLFPDVPLIRMDADTTGSKGAHRRHLRAFASQKPAILLGTQMVAKGLDFPEVSLIGVINADTSLNMPDFRAAERTFQLLMQVSGRSGRGEYPGTVIIQTYLPDHYAIKAVVDGNMGRFYNLEMKYRRDSGYPPFSKMLNIVISGAEKERVKEKAHKIHAFLKDNISEPAIYGPGPAPIPKLKQSWRWHLFLTTGEPVAIKKLISDNWSKVFSGDKNSKVIVDVDPSWIL